MSGFEMWLLGSPRLEGEGEPLEIETRKAMALLVYLAVTGTGHSRDALATLLWPDHDQQRARAYLRRALWTLNNALPGSCLAVDRKRVSLVQSPDIWIDVQQFQQLLAVREAHNHQAIDVCADCLPPLSQAVELYRDDFLMGFTLSDCRDFDEWQFFQTESLRQQLATALECLTQAHSDQGDFESAITHARRRLGLDPEHEPAHRQLMQLYARAGQQAAALRQ